MNTKKDRNRRRLATISAGVSCALLFWVFAGLDWALLLRELKRLNPIAAIAPAALMVITFWIRAVRWKLLLGGKGAVRSLYEATVVGAFGNAILPLRAGEFLRPWLLARDGAVTFSNGFASVVTERLFDVLGLLLFLAASLGSIPELPPVVALGAQALGVMSGGLVVVMAVAYLAHDWLVGTVRTICRRLLPEAFAGRISRLVEEFLSGLRAIRSARELLGIVALTVLLWGTVGLYHLSGFWLLGVYPAFPIGVITAVVIGLAVAAPSGPGFVGTYQFGCVVAISTICRYEREFALAYSVVLHIFSTILLCVFGMRILHKRGLILRKIADEAEHQELT